MIARFEMGKIKSYSNHPKTLVVNDGANVLNYRKATHRHASDGFRSVADVTFDSATHKRGEIYFDEVNNYFTYYILELTAQDLDNRIPSQLTKIQFKTGLLVNHGITNVVVQAFFDSLPESMTKQTLILGWNESTEFDRKDENLRNFAPYLGVTLEQLDQIFIDFNGI